MQRYLEEFEKELVLKRLRLFRWVVLGVGILIIFRFWQLQIFQGAKWRILATENQFRKVRVLAGRGFILDRKGRVLAKNRPGFNLAVIPADVNKKTIGLLAGILNMPAESLEERLRTGERWSPFVPVTIRENLSWEETSRLEEHSRDLSGVDIEYRPIREYPKGEAACHILGYIGEISPLELEQPQFARYQLGDYMGKAGVEKLLEKWLRGTDGYKFKMVDAQGRERPPSVIPGISFESKEPVAGKNVKLTIDLDLQELAASLLKDKAGSIVMLSVKDGKVLTMANSPTFNPELFGNPFHPEAWRKLETDPSHPLYNRAIQGIYPPGSTFKVVEALAGLNEKVVAPNQMLRCSGVFYFGGIPFKCWRKGGHGSIVLKDAIIQSCDIYFYQLGHRLGVDRIAHYANLLGLGMKTGIGFPNESGGLIPTSLWREKVRGEKWHPGDTISVAIGQGFVLVTPLQQAVVAMVIANEGRIFRPVLLEAIQGVPDQQLREYTAQMAGLVNFAPETWKLVKTAMSEVVSSPSGTAYWGARSDKVKIAGKTGTAQVVKSKRFEGVSEKNIPVNFRDHAWFIAYAPADNPKVAVSVLVEHGGHGSSAAAPLARTMIEKYMEIYEPEQLTKSEKTTKP